MTSVQSKYVVNEFQKRRKTTLYQAVIPGLAGFTVSLVTISFPANSWMKPVRSSFSSVFLFLQSGS